MRLFAVEFRVLEYGMAKFPFTVLVFPEVRIENDLSGARNIPDPSSVVRTFSKQSEILLQAVKGIQILHRRSVPEIHRRIWPPERYLVSIDIPRADLLSRIICRPSDPELDEVGVEIEVIHLVVDAGIFRVGSGVRSGAAENPCSEA